MMSLFAEFIGWAVLAVLTIVALIWLLRFITRLYISVMMARQWKKEENR
jgi:beta-lactamase regulating signal transducer with metallopeptidase domain